jgi:hypothetical protein
MSQILVQLVLQSSVLSLLFFKQERGRHKKKKKEKQNKMKNSFPLGKPVAVLVPACPGTSLAVVCNKELFSGLIVEIYVHPICWLI